MVGKAEYLLTYDIHNPEHNITTIFNYFYGDKDEILDYLRDKLDRNKDQLKQGGSAVVCTNVSVVRL